MKPRILVIDDEAAIRDSMRMILEYDGYEVCSAATGEEGRRAGRARSARPGVPRHQDAGHGRPRGAAAAAHRRRDCRSWWSRRTGHQHRGRGDRLGAFDFIEKPLESDRVLVTVRNALDTRGCSKREPHASSATPRSAPPDGRRAPALRRCASAIKKAAPTNATVLIWGESGVGKELVARAIHRNSLRAPRAVRAGQLRGDSRRADRVGAVRPREGLVHRRDREADRQVRAGRPRHDLPRRSRRHEPKTQAKVLRVLQEGEVERLGSARTIKVDVRVIAATNKDLEEEIAKGTFREDLYFRLSVIPIHVPPLRERRDDIPRWSGTSPTCSAARTTARRKRSRPRRSSAAAAALARQHPRAAQRRRAADHQRRRHRRVDDVPRTDGCRGDPRPARRRRRAAPSAPSRPGALREFKEVVPSGPFWWTSSARTAGTSRRPPR